MAFHARLRLSVATQLPANRFLDQVTFSYVFVTNEATAGATLPPGWARLAAAAVGPHLPAFARSGELVFARSEKFFKILRPFFPELTP